ncbi:MMPL family transporter [Streptomyces roseirectus]|uniref:MMPL family transporter n=1 Tax=Streptomyces roseirectus TaxID=2768066 RepID=A0A7H0I7U0_9ACTN|nr:MMPL family transporter [Streptomyces roseirectus]QNP68856.1 MMPL family transporter [Streptomyces roseirectus]
MNRVTLFAAVVLAALCGLFGAMTGDRLTANGWFPPEAPALRAEQFLGREFERGTPDLILMVRARDDRDSADTPAVAAVGAAVADTVQGAARTHYVTSYWSTHDPGLRSADGHGAVVAAKFEGDDDTVHDAVSRAVKRLAGERAAATVTAVGQPVVHEALETQAHEDLLRAELFTAPLILLLLVVIFRSLPAALLPVLVGAMATTVTSALLGALALLTPVSVFALNITTALGFGLAVDYSLLMLTRFRQEVSQGARVPAAVRTTLSTAGRTVLYSGLAVSLCLTALLVFPIMFLRSMAYGGILVTAVSVAATLTVLPAAFALFASRLTGTGVLGRGRPAATESRGRAGEALWDRALRGVRRAPVTVALATTTLVCLMAAPFTQVSFGLLDDRALPAGAAVRTSTDTLRADFPALAATRLPVALPGFRGPDAELARYSERLSRLPDVERVTGPAGTYAAGRVTKPATPARDGRGSWVEVTVHGAPFDRSALRALDAVESVPAPARPLTGGPTALLRDTRAALADRLPFAVALVALAMSALLFAFTGSVLIPVKALALTALSMTAAMGTIVYVFQEGHLRDLVGPFTVVGTADLSMTILVICIAFALSMDYEVFLLSAIRERYVATGDNTTAVSEGLRRTGPLITSASVLIAVVFLGQATSTITPLKTLGVGVVVTILLDAVVIRMLLVPAFMFLAGRANWWSPPLLTRLHARVSLSET